MYAYHPTKAKRKAHILAPDGKTWCKVENGSKPGSVSGRSELAPVGRDICYMCLNLSANPNENPDRLNNARKPSDGFYTSWKWAKLRFEVLRAYGAICMCCRATEDIVVDHIKPRKRYPDLEFDFNNLQVLCDFCNRGKSWDDETDFRPKKPEPELPEDQMEHLKSIQ